MDQTRIAVVIGTFYNKAEEEAAQLRRPSRQRARMQWMGRPILSCLSSYVHLSNHYPFC